ncbi:MAG: hypothetical protein A2096_07015 [Spirochaetes bacterium GWF1_41_5]|nr:MAG: hypothetical protein A2096_07015 [Spirochaetes bacterium GWF1_41_5]
MHLKGIEYNAVPEWVIEKYNPPVVEMPLLQDTQPWRLTNVLPFNPEVDRSFNECLASFGKTGIAQDTNLVYAYIHGISTSRGEEMFIRPMDAALYEKLCGLSPEIFAAWLKRRIDSMTAAFKGVEYKLANMFDGPVGPPTYASVNGDLWTYAFDRGTGIRGGGIDFQHGLFSAEGWSSSVDKNGYCIVDDTATDIKESRFRGDENEEYGRGWEWRFGPYEGHEYRHRICSLRGLQMRQNFQMVSTETLKLNPEINEYVRITQGYRRENSPDAWAYLRECYPRTRAAGVKNIERWLMQRDLPGSMSVPDKKIERFKLASDISEKSYDFDARRTDRANGQDGLAFILDRVFWAKPATALVKVTYTDIVAAKWLLHYADARGEIRKSVAIENTGNGTLKTATIRIDSLAASGKFQPQRSSSRLPMDDRTEIVENSSFEKGLAGWTSGGDFYTAGKDDETSASVTVYTLGKANDTVHLDQIIRLKNGTSYLVSVRIKNLGTKLKPGLRIAGMDWNTVLYLESKKMKSWEEVSGTFQNTEDRDARLQVFGQGRGNAVAGQSGSVLFTAISIRPAGSICDEYPPADFRIITEGPGDVSITMVRVIK